VSSTSGCKKAALAGFQFERPYAIESQGFRIPTRRVGYCVNDKDKKEEDGCYRRLTPCLTPLVLEELFKIPPNFDVTSVSTFVLRLDHLLVLVRLQES
jgi:hypothetical protein